MDANEEQAILRALMDFGDHAPDIRERIRLLGRLQDEGSDPTKRQLAEAMVFRMASLAKGLRESRDEQAQLAGMIEELTAPPWHPWIFRGICTTTRGDEAVISRKGTTRIVPAVAEVDLSALRIGDEVLLGQEMNIVMAVSPWGQPCWGETALFNRLTADGRLVVKWRDEEFVVEAGGGLAAAELSDGDEVRWDRTEGLAYEKIERPDGAGHFLEETPNVTFDDIGGLDDAIARITRALTLHMKYPQVAARLSLGRVKAILFAGPPGGGKTMLAQAIANWIGQLTGSGRSHFINVKPGGPLSMWFGQSEENIRELFRVAREQAVKEPDVPVVIFFDEVDSIAHNRGASLNQADDRVVNALTAELQGLEDRGNVVVIAATNRLKDMSSAMLRPGRLGDLIVQVSRPNMAAAREIFAKHLPAALPYDAAPDAEAQAAARDHLIDAAASAIFAPNVANRLATVTLRDNTRRTVTAADLVSGATIQKIARVASEALAQRMIAACEAGQGDQADAMGLTLDDVLTAVSDEFASAAGVLTRKNIRRYVADLPEESDVTSVEVIDRHVLRPHQYVNLSVA